MTELTPKQRYYQNWKTKDPERYLAQSKKTCQWHKEKYANDPEYRAKQLQKAKDYAEILGLKFAYATNGREIIEFDFLTGVEQKIDRYPFA